MANMLPHFSVGPEFFGKWLYELESMGWESELMRTLTESTPVQHLTRLRLGSEYVDVTHANGSSLDDLVPSHPVHVRISSFSTLGEPVLLSLCTYLFYKKSVQVDYSSVGTAFQKLSVFLLTDNILKSLRLAAENGKTSEFVSLLFPNSEAVVGVAKTSRGRAEIAKKLRVTPGVTEVQPKVVCVA